ncbi:MAG: Bax inhibitor-1 family protein [Acidimicrobiales bacterium]
MDGTTLFGQTMWLVALTAGLFTAGAYLGRSLAYGAGLLFYLGALACLIGMRFAVRRSGGSAVGLLFVFGLLMGLASAPTLAYYADTNPQALWQAGGATALFMVGLGALGYGSRRDLSALGRISFWALVALVLLGIILIFVQIPNGDVIYSVLGLVVFAGLTLYDFQRLRRTRDVESAPMMAASIFLDILNVFLFFLNLFDRRR